MQWPCLSIPWPSHFSYWLHSLALDPTLAIQSAVHGPAVTVSPKTAFHLIPEPKIPSCAHFETFALPWACETNPPVIFMIHSVTAFRSLPQCHLHRKAIPDPPKLHFCPMSCFTFFIAFITTWHYFICILLFNSFYKYLWNTHYVPDTVLSPGDRKENNTKPLHPPLECNGLQIQVVSCCSVFLYLLIPSRRGPIPTVNRRLHARSHDSNPPSTVRLLFKENVQCAFVLCWAQLNLVVFDPSELSQHGFPAAEISLAWCKPPTT